jgi:hypothetical protein
MRIVVAGVCAAVAMGLLAGSYQAGEKAKAKYSIKEVMKKAHDKKTGLLYKVGAGNGDKADAEKLLEMYIEMAKNNPPKGGAESWKRLTNGLIVAAKVAVTGGPDAGEKLKTASACTACHKVHKGPKR